jgi:hypothetical protein
MIQPVPCDSSWMASGFIGAKAESWLENKLFRTNALPQTLAFPNRLKQSSRNTANPPKTAPQVLLNI